MNVQIFFRVVYGNQLIYPANEPARKLADFAGCKTFTSTQLQRLREAGCEIESVRDPRASIVSCVLNGDEPRDVPTTSAAPTALMVLAEVRDFWEGGDCPPDLMAKINRVIERGAP